MTMQYDVKATHLELTGYVVQARARVKGYQVLGLPDGSGGEITFRDGGPSGAVQLQFNVPPGIIPSYVLVPGEGVLFQNNIHVTLPEDVSITVFYG